MEMGWHWVLDSCLPAPLYSFRSPRLNPPAPQPDPYPLLLHNDKRLLPPPLHSFPFNLKVPHHLRQYNPQLRPRQRLPNTVPWPEAKRLLAGPFVGGELGGADGGGEKAGWKERFRPGEVGGGEGKGGGGDGDIGLRGEKVSLVGGVGGMVRWGPSRVRGGNARKRYRRPLVLDVVSLLGRDYIDEGLHG